jgi:glyoxylase-like metal-dependent hydrolase (beta-lactamase superfamily II)
MVFSDAPTWSTLAGAALIVASGLYILHRELRARSGGRSEHPLPADDPLPPGAGAAGRARHPAHPLRQSRALHLPRHQHLADRRRASVAVLDPGPADEAHLAAILRATAGERITHILVSHTHRDHSPGAAALQAATGARLGFGPHVTPPDQGGEGATTPSAPTSRCPTARRCRARTGALDALHTPGHCANHLCFALEGRRRACCSAPTT